jgi:hypothetical protein
MLGPGVPEHSAAGYAIMNGMNPERAKEIAERDQLWASLRTLRPQLDRLAGGDYDGCDIQKQIITLLARIVVAEMDFRARDSEPDAAE